MPPVRVDFYLLEDSEPKSSWLIACRLLEKAYLRGHRTFVQCESLEEAHYLDELLWTFKEESFIPHNLLGEGPEPPPPIQIGYEHEPRGFNDILLNMACDIPTYCAKFRRIIEIVPALDAAKEVSREHYRFYRSKGYELHTHPIT